MLMLNNILQIKITKLSEVIKVLAIDSIPVEGFYITLNIFPQIIISPQRIESQHWNCFCWEDNLLLYGFLANYRFFLRKLYK